MVDQQYYLYICYCTLKMANYKITHALLQDSFKENVLFGQWKQMKSFDEQHLYQRKVTLKETAIYKRLHIFHNGMNL